MRLFAGIDGGQSSTVAVVADERGRVLGRGTAGAADEVGESRDSTRLRDTLEAALASALNAAKLPPDTRLEAVVAGVSGYDGRVYGAPPRFAAARARLLHDAPVAHAAAFGGKPGVVVVAGTGSVAYGVGRDGADATVGGWGFLFGDEGAAFGIAREALAAAAYAEDTADARDALLALARHAFGHLSMRALVRAIYAGEIERRDIATFAPRVIDCALEGDRVATDIVLAAAVALVRQAQTCARRVKLRAARVAFVGGMLAGEWYSHVIDLALRQIAKSLRRVEPLHEPAVGALLLAYREAGLSPVPSRISSEEVRS